MKRSGRRCFAALALIAGTLDAAEWTAGLVGYLPLDGDLRYVQPGGEEGQATFARAGRAFTEALTPLDEHQPRYRPGRFGQGVWLEPGQEGTSTPECRNWLPPPMAEILPAGTNACGAYRAAGAARIELIAAADGRNENVREGTHALRIINETPLAGAESAGTVQVPGGRYFLSLYTRGAGMGTNGAAIRLEVVDATNTVLGSADVAV
ncbi:MAG: hypothetical protein PHR35_20035, partial [Kiritimatiellae bacterium]|nr:hypothetical protein [Kiritimatiellia bacterium]